MLSLERAAVAEQVASDLRHDMRNKLAGIRNATAYIKRSMDKSGTLHQDPRIARFLDLIVEQLEGADGLLSERAEFKHLLEGETTEQSVDDCIRQLLDDWRQSWGESAVRNITVDLDAAQVFSFDRRALQFCLERLVENALDEIGPGGSVFVSTKQSDEDVQVRVQDTAGSFSAERAERALQSFVSTKKGHAGIGLNMAARFARRLDGELLLPEGERTAPELHLRIPQRDT